MAICCDSLKTVFFVPQIAGIEVFRRFLFEVNNPVDPEKPAGRRPKARHMHRVAGYAPVPFDEAISKVPDGYRTVALIVDPADLIVHTWRAHASERSTRRRQEIEKFRENDLIVAPSFGHFSTHRSDYANCSERISNALTCLERGLGEDLSIFDETLRVDIPEEVEAFFSPDIWARMPETLKPANAALTVDPPAAPLRQPTLGLFSELSGHYDGDQPYFERTKSQLFRKVEEVDVAVPQLQRGAPVKNGLHVVCMLKETPEVVARFVDYYRALGCESINLYFDDPDDAAAAKYDDVSDVVVTRCSMDFWGKKRKPSIAGRQILCYNDCYQRLTGSGWLIVCDSDEFVTSYPGTTFAEMAETAPAEQRVIRFQSAEAVWEKDASDYSLCSATYVRTATPLAVWKEVRAKKPEENWGLYRKGLLSHGSGKYMARLGQDVRRLQTHKATYHDGYDSMSQPVGNMRGVLVHFYALSFEHWKRKAKDRSESASHVWGLDAARDKQVKLFENSEEEKMLNVFRDLYAIDKEEADTLTKAGLLYEIKIFDGLSEHSAGSTEPIATDLFQSRRASSSQSATAPDEA